MTLSIQEIRQADVIRLFEEQFLQPPSHVVRAPGRVNLIGEHTDYNQGYVLPMAIEREMMIAARVNDSDDNQVSIYSRDYGELDSFSLENLQPHPTLDWSNYLRGVLKIFQDEGHKLPSFNAVLSGDVPQGAGLSSSAAYEVAVATLLNEFLHLDLSKEKIALLSQRSENEFIGVQCGIMDQFISALGKAEAALMIDCRNLNYKTVPLLLNDKQLCIVITNSGVRRGLVNSAYNERRLSCQEGVKELARLLSRPGLDSLRDVRLDEFVAVASSLPQTLSKRCHHVISENERVLLAVAALENDDLEDFGHLMNASHESLKNYFEVSCGEIDFLVEAAQQLEGVLGSRITGGGFGGCTVTLMQQDALHAYQTTVLPKYERHTGCKPDVYVSVASPGASFLLCPGK
ncbi:MAG TPA: galactokinase [Oculatellaceae cyanobacterium]